MPNYQPFGNSMPTSTQPYGYPMGGAFSPQQPPMPQYPAQPVRAPFQTNIIFVSGLPEVQMKPQPANSRCVYFDNDKSILYQKTVDEQGHFEISQYDLIEHAITDGEKGENSAQTIDQSKFVLKKDFEALQAQMRALELKLKGGVSGGTATVAK